MNIRKTVIDMNSLLDIINAGTLLYPLTKLHVVMAIITAWAWLTIISKPKLHQAIQSIKLRAQDCFQRLYTLAVTLYKPTVI